MNNSYPEYHDLRRPVQPQGEIQHSGEVQYNGEGYQPQHQFFPVCHQIPTIFLHNNHMPSNFPHVTNILHPTLPQTSPTPFLLIHIPHNTFLTTHQTPLLTPISMLHPLPTQQPAPPTTNPATLVPAQPPTNQQQQQLSHQPLPDQSKHSEQHDRHINYQDRDTNYRGQRHHELDRDAQFYKSIAKAPKMDFPRFDGSNPEEWL
jgi:hypothetical protein